MQMSQTPLGFYDCDVNGSHGRRLAGKLVKYH